MFSGVFMGFGSFGVFLIFRSKGGKNFRTRREGGAKNFRRVFRGGRKILDQHFFLNPWAKKRDM